MKPQFADVKQRPIVFPLLLPAFLTWGGAGGPEGGPGASHCALSVLPSVPPCQSFLTFPRQMKALETSSVRPPVPTWLCCPPIGDGLSEPPVLLPSMGRERGSFQGGLPLESLMVMCPREGRGTWLVGEVAGVPLNPTLCQSAE